MVEQQQQEKQNLAIPAAEEEQRGKDEVNKIWKELNEEAVSESNAEFKKMIRSNEYTFEDENVTYKFKMLNHKDMGAMKEIQKEKVDEENWPAYVENFRKRAKLLIKDMDDQTFDDRDFFNLENLITAWTIRATRGFRHLLKVS